MISLNNTFTSTSRLVRQFYLLRERERGAGEVILEREREGNSFRRDFDDYTDNEDIINEVSLQNCDQN